MTDHFADVREEADPGARDDLLDRLDQRPADQAVRSQLGSDLRGTKRLLLGLGHDLEVAGMPVGADVVEQPRKLPRSEPDVLAADVPDPAVGDGCVHLARLCDRHVIAGQHEDELTQLQTPSCRTTFVYLSV